MSSGSETPRTRALAVWMRWTTGSPPIGTKAATICPARPTSMASEKPVETGYRPRTWWWNAVRSTAGRTSPAVNSAAEAGWVPR